MVRISQQDFAEEDGEESGLGSFKTLSAEEAQRLRLQQPQPSLWSIFFLQISVALALVALTWLLTVENSTVWSVAYGTLSVILPSAVLMRGMASKNSYLNTVSVVVGFFVWELVKIGLTISMLSAAVWVVNDLSWPALLVGLILTMKVSWLAIALQQRKANQGTN